MFKEPHIRETIKKLYKPDLIFVKDGRAFVVEATVRHDASKTCLEEATAEKVNM